MSSNTTTAQITESPTENRARPGNRSRLAFLVFAWILVACVVIQVFLAGIATFDNPLHWSWHTNFVHFFELVPIILLVLSFSGRMPVRMRWLSGALFFLLGMQYMFASSFEGSDQEWIGAFHVVNALLIFWLAVTLAQWARRLL